MTAQPNKDTVYIDADDEITNIIEKVRSSDQRIVALVLPKRAAVLQSIVNMKLLKRTADGAKKHVVLITSEAGLLPLAGAIGLHVAKNLQTKPAIPPRPDRPTLDEPQVEEDEIDAPDALDATKSVGELASGGADDAIELDSDGLDVETPAPSKKPKGNKGGKFKIPNFERFRLLVLLGGVGLVVLMVGLYFAIAVMPKARITIKTDTSTINSNIPFTASTSATVLDETGKIVPAKRQEVKKTDAEKMATSGQKDVGTKAAGDMTLTIACSAVSGAPPQVPAGTGVSANGLTFITQTAVSLTSPDFSDGCSFKGSTTVLAQNNGDQYNLDGRDYTVAGFSSVKGRGEAMTGGTSKIIKVVAQADVDTAKQKLTSKPSQSSTDELKQGLQAADMLPLVDTLVTSEPALTVTPAVGQEATEVTVASVTTFTMVGIKEKDLQTLVEADAKKQIDTKKQSILDNGIKDASFVVADSKTAEQLKITVQSAVKAGPHMDIDVIKREIAGKKKGQTANIIQARPGIKEVTVDYSPFWVSKTPKKPSKITLVFDKPSNAKP